MKRLFLRYLAAPLKPGSIRRLALAGGVVAAGLLGWLVLRDGGSGISSGALAAESSGGTPAASVGPARTALARADFPLDWQNGTFFSPPAMGGAPPEGEITLLWSRNAPVTGWQRQPAPWAEPLASSGLYAPYALYGPYGLYAPPAAAPVTPYTSFPATPHAPPRYALAGAGGLATQAEINSLIGGLEQALTALEANLIQQVFGEELPLVGDQLASAAAQGLPALHHVTGLKNALKSGLGTLNGSATYTKAQVEQAVRDALAAASITVGAVTLDASNPTDLKLTFNTSRAFAAFNAPLDGALGLPGLGMQTSGQASTTLTYTLNATVGVDAQGFYLNTASGASTFTAGFTITLPGLNVSANLSKLRFRLSDEAADDGDSVPPTSFTGTFAMRLLDPSGADNRLRVNEIGGDLLDATLSGAAAINLNLATDLGDARFPALSADLNFAWNFSNSPVVIDDLNATFGARPTLAFRKVTLDLGSFFTKFARPMLETVRDVTEPLQPMVKAVTEPIPLLTDLHGINAAMPETLLELGVANGTVSREQADRFDILSKIIEISNALPTDAAQGVKIDLGDFNLGTADPRVPDFDLAGVTPTTIRQAAAAALQHPLVQQTLSKFAEIPAIPGSGNNPGQGLRFPILDKPETAFGLLLGKNVDLFTFDNATQDITFLSLDEFFKIVWPLGFRLQGNGHLRVDLDFGYDTRGLVQFLGTGDAGDILNGFYVKVPVNSSGQPIAMAELDADIYAYPAINLVVAEAGAGGGLYANVQATLADPDQDRRVHLDEFFMEFKIHPLCVLQAQGTLTFGLRAYVEVGIDPFSYTLDYEFPVGTLVDFSFACEDSPKPILARVLDGDARLHLGPEAGRRQYGNLLDGAENFTLTHLSGDPGSETIGVAYVVDGGTSGGFGALPYGPVSGVIRGDGGAQDDIIRLAPGITTPAHLSGNEGIDTLVGAQGNDVLDGGEGRDFLTGRGGNDTLRGGPGNDVLNDGPGADVLDGGDGTDLVTYRDAAQGIVIDLVTGQTTNDAAGDTFISIEQFEGTPYDDTLRGGPGSDLFLGGAGNDILEGRDGDDALEGGPGADSIRGGSGYDFTSYLHSPQGVNVNLLTGVATGGDALDSIEGLIGSLFNDTLIGDASNNRIYGYEGHDHLEGGEGDDWIEGGAGNDDIDGGPGNDVLWSGDGMDNDTVRGGPGNDVIHSAPDYIPVPGGLIPTPNYLEGGDGNDIIYTGGGDTADAGDGDDFVHAAVGPAKSELDPAKLPYPHFETVNGVYRLAGMRGVTLQGGPGNDTVSFTGQEQRAYRSRRPNDWLMIGVHVNLATGEVYGAAGECVVQGFENIIGTDAGDTLIGTDGPNIFEPLRGGGYSSYVTSGPDNIQGRGGVDTMRIDFSLADQEEFGPVRMNSYSMTRAGADSYLFYDVEQLEITGASEDDQIYPYANGYNDILIGLGGNDILGGYGGSDILRGGEGNDTLTAIGRASLDIYGIVDGHDILDGGPGDDILEDFAVQFGSGIPQVTEDAVFEIDGGPGFDTVSMTLSNQTIPIIWDSEAPTNLEFPNGTFIRNFERISRLATGSGNDNIRQLGRVNNYILLGPGDDVVNAGLGFDTLDGGPGNDLVIIDFSVGDDPDVGGVYENSGYRRQRTTAPFNSVDVIAFSQFERVHLTGGSKNDILNGGAGDDTLIGGAGDDKLDAGSGNNILDGGPGNDTLRTYSTPATVPTNDTMRGGPGDDILRIDYGGPPTNGYGVDVMEGGDGDDTIINVWFDKSFGRIYATADTRMYLDGGAGYDTLSADFANQTEDIVFIQGRDNSQTFPDGSYFRHFETIRSFNSGSGNDRFIFSGRSTKDIACGPGDDYVNPGLGQGTLFGGTGDDTLVVDYSVLDEENLSGVYNPAGGFLQRRDVSTGQVIDSFQLDGFEHGDLTGGSKDDYLPGTNGSDILRGNGGNDQLLAYGGADVLIGCATTGARGAAEIDQLTGGTGADTFVLGDVEGRFYDDGNPGTAGQEGYAKITDFTPAQGDRLRLHAPSSSYLLGPSPIAGVNGTALFHDSNGNGTLDATDELIATLGTGAITAANTLDTAEIATAQQGPLTFASIGFTGLQPALTTTGPVTPTSAFKLAFSMNENLPSGVTLEVQASADLGRTDPWHTIASKTGSGAWTGPAAAVVSAPSNGQVTITLTLPQTITQLPNQSLRCRLTGP